MADFDEFVVPSCHCCAIRVTAYCEKAGWDGEVMIDGWYARSFRLSSWRSRLAQAWRILRGDLGQEFLFTSRHDLNKFQTALRLAANAAWPLPTTLPLDDHRKQLTPAHDVVD